METPEVRDVGFSDHSCLLWSLNVSRPTPVYRRLECRQWKSFKIDLFQNDLSNSDLCCMDNVADDCQSTSTIDGCGVLTEMISKYDDTLSVLLNRHAPMKSISLRERPSNIWFDEECRKEKIRVRLLERRAQSTGDPVHRLAWVDGVKYMHKLFSAKKSALMVD